MPRYQHLFFDLDGTLTDPAPGITNCIIYARKKWGLPCGPNEEYYPFIGPPMPDSFVNFWGMDPEDAVRFLASFRERFSTIGLFENEVYPGMNELLRDLKAAGCHLYIATSKPTVFAKKIAEKFDFSQYFDMISGGELNGDHVSKTEVIQIIKDQFALDMKDAVMIGDRSYDAEGAAHFSIPCIGAGYGYGGREELSQAGVSVIVDSVQELRDYLVNYSDL